MNLCRCREAPFGEGDCFSSGSVWKVSTKSEATLSLEEVGGHSMTGLLASYHCKYNLVNGRSFTR